MTEKLLTDDLVPLVAPPGVSLSDWGTRLYDIRFIDPPPGRGWLRVEVPEGIARLAHTSAATFIMSLGEADIVAARRDPVLFKAEIDRLASACEGSYDPDLAKRIEVSLRLSGLPAAVFLLDHEAAVERADMRGWEPMQHAELGLGWSADVAHALLSRNDEERGLVLVPFWVNLLAEIIIDRREAVRKPGWVYSTNDYAEMEDEQVRVERDVRMRLSEILRIAGGDIGQHVATRRIIDTTARLGGKQGLIDLIPVLDQRGPL